MSKADEVIDLKTESAVLLSSSIWRALACSVRYVTLGVCDFNQQQRNGARELILLITPNTTF